MSNNSDPVSPNKFGFFRGLIALLTALGGGTGIVALLVFVQSTSQQVQTPEPNPSNRTNPSVTESVSPPTLEPTPTYSSNSSIEWGNLEQYFDLKSINFKEGFQQAASELSFVAKANGDFSGDFVVYFYDAEGIKICPSILEIPRNCSLLGFEGSVNFSTKDSTDNFAFWETNESDRIVILVPSNASVVELNFNQSSF
jgi:hypothetical protein